MSPISFQPGFGFFPRIFPCGRELERASAPFRDQDWAAADLEFNAGVDSPTLRVDDLTVAGA